MPIIRLQTKTVYLLTQFVKVVRISQILHGRIVVSQLNQLACVFRLEHAGIENAF